MVFLPQTGQGYVIEVDGEDWFFDPSGRLLNRPDPDPYDPCWCGSGKKFRFCHSNRHCEPRITGSEFLAGWEAAADIEMCLHPEAGQMCSSKIVRAHTVQRMGGGLRSIARSGEVYGFKWHPYSIQKNHLQVIPERIGTRKASTFRGFCSKHDAALFQPVEHRGFTGGQQQLALLNFRAVAHRVYTRHVAVRHAPRMLDYDRGLPPRVQREWFAMQHREVVNSRETLRNVECLKADYDQLVMAGGFGETNGYVAHFSGRPDFLCAELVNIEYAFDGGRLEQPQPPAHLCAYNFATHSGWSFVFSWTGSNPAAERLVLSFDARPDVGKPAAILRYAIEYTDNIYFAPEWWESLPSSERSYAIFALTRRMHPHYLRDQKFLLATDGMPMRSEFVGADKIGSWCAAA